MFEAAAALGTKEGGYSSLIDLRDRIFWQCGRKDTHSNKFA
jgi:hypothetical protein